MTTAKERQEAAAREVLLEEAGQARALLVAEAVEAARDVARSVEKMTGEVEHVRNKGRINRLLIWSLAAFVTIGFGIGLGWTINQQEDQAQAAHTQCVLSNQARTIALNLWTDALRERQGPAAQTQQLIHEAQIAYAERAC